MPGTVMPSPHPVACWTSCCTRTCAQPQGRPYLGAEPLLHPTPWAQAHWAALHPEVEQVCCWRWEHPNPVGVGCVSVAGFQVCLDDGHLMFLGVRSFSCTPGHRPVCAQGLVSSADQVLTGIQLVLPSASPEPAAVAASSVLLPCPADVHPCCPFAVDIAVITGLHAASPFGPSWTIPQSLWACQEGWSCSPC